MVKAAMQLTARRVGMAVPGDTLRPASPGTRHDSRLAQ